MRHLVVEREDTYSTRESITVLFLKWQDCLFQCFLSPLDSVSWSTALRDESVLRAAGVDLALVALFAAQHSLLAWAPVKQALQSVFGVLNRAVYCTSTALALQVVPCPFSHVGWVIGSLEYYMLRICRALLGSINGLCCYQALQFFFGWRLCIVVSYICLLGICIG